MNQAIELAKTLLVTAAVKITKVLLSKTVALTVVISITIEKLPEVNITSTLI